MATNFLLLDRVTVTRWMRRNRDEHLDEYGDVNLTALAEAAAERFGAKDVGGPLDDPAHWIWDAAVEAAEA
jgi:hypothetical protein